MLPGTAEASGRALERTRGTAAVCVALLLVPLLIPHPALAAIVAPGCVACSVAPLAAIREQEEQLLQFARVVEQERARSSELLTGGGGGLRLICAPVPPPSRKTKPEGVRKHFKAYEGE